MDKHLAPLDIADKIIVVRDQYVMLDSDVAALYGVETKRINEAVRNNPDKFPAGYVLTPDYQEFIDLKSKISTSSCDDTTSQNTHGGKRKHPKLFTEKGLYMLATILKGEVATQATLSIIETYAQVREMRRDLLALHNEKNPTKQKGMMQRFGEVLSNIVMPDLQKEETESTLELNFVIGKITHTVKRRRSPKKDEIEQD